MTDFNNLTIKPQSESSVVIYFGESISEKVLESITIFNARIHQIPFYGFIETVPAYISLTIFYDPLKVLRCEIMEGRYAFERVISFLKNLSTVNADMEINNRDQVVIPVCYGHDYGPDIEEVARHNKLTISEVISLHSGGDYLVYMLGFMPGFPYLGGMDKSLATPRKNSPRKIVPAGSVGIAGAQTGVYPLQSPGGWQLIGRTPLTLFNPDNPSPALIKAGDSIKFSVITAADFIELNH